MLRHPEGANAAHGLPPTLLLGQAESRGGQVQGQLLALEDRGRDLGVLVEEGGGGVTGHEVGRAQDRGERLPVGRHTGHAHPLEAGGQRGSRDLTGGTMRDHLGQHRVVEGADLRAGGHAGLEPDAARRIHLEELDAAHPGQVPPGRVLGVEAHLDRMPGPGDLGLLEGERLPLGDPDLPLDEVQAGDLLGHGVLHLQAGVHLEEEELLLSAVAGHHELHRAGPDVVDGLCRSDRRGIHALQGGRGRPG